MIGNITKLEIRRWNAYKKQARSKTFDFVTIADKMRVAQYLRRQAKDGYEISEIRPWISHTYRIHIDNIDSKCSGTRCKISTTPEYQHVIVENNEIFFAIHHNTQYLQTATRIIPETVEIEEIPEFVPFENFYRKNEPLENLLGDDMIAVLNDMNFSVSSNGHTEYYDSYETALESTKTLDLFGIDWVLYELDSYSKYGDVISIPIADSVNGEY